MNISQLLEALKDPSINLTVGEKLLAGFSVTILSMVVVFIVLIIISTIISLLQREKTNKPAQLIKNEETDLGYQSTNSDYENNEELVSVITASTAAATGNSTNNILVKKIVRSNNSKTSWESMAKNATK
jgi:Na+-transporting methylmalonyl-CoA/oxaloacetate decarboxylase gamma subunit